MLGPILTVLPLVLFYIFVSIFSDGAESSARGKVAAIAIVATVLLRGVSAAMPTLLGLLLACLAASAVSLTALILWIKVTRPQAIKITGAYLGSVIGLWVVLDLILRPTAA